MRTMMRGKHGKKSRFPALAALALCAVLIVTFMPNLMFSANAEENQPNNANTAVVQSFNTPDASTLEAETESAAQDLVNSKYPSLKGTVRSGDTEKSEVLVPVKWTLDTKKSDDSLYVFQAELKDANGKDTDNDGVIYSLNDSKMTLPEVSVKKSEKDDGTTADLKNSSGVSSESKLAGTDSEKNQYSYEDKNIKASAQLTDADAIPDNAVLKVKPIKKGTKQYATYLKKLTASDKNKWGNYLLYDISFIENGKKIEPDSGRVHLQVKFKNGQLTKKLNAKSADDISVIHFLSDNSSKEDVQTLKSTTKLHNQTVSFSTSSFSTFVFKTQDGKTTVQDHYWEGNKEISFNDIQSALQGTDNFAVYANKLINKVHLEGNVKVGELETYSNSEIINKEEAVISRNNIKSIKVVKNLTSALDWNQTFKFGIYRKEGNDYSLVGQPFPVEVNKGATSVCTEINDKKDKNIFEEINKDKSNKYYVFELDGQDRLIKQDSVAQIGNKLFSVSYQNNEIIPPGNFSNFANYIGKITNGDDNTATLVLDPKYFCGGDDYNRMTYIEDFSDVDRNDKSYTFKSGETPVEITGYYNDPPQNNIGKGENIKQDVRTTLEQLGRFSITLANAKNGPKSGEGALSVINLQSTTGKLREDLENAGFANMQNGDGIQGTIDGNEYLLINIDVGSQTTYYLDKIVIDGKDPDGNEELARHVILNFIQGDGSGGYKPYSGKIYFSNVSAGLLLAPEATVYQAGGFRGQEIANVFDRRAGAETHRDLITQPVKRVVTVSNSPVGSVTDVSVTKNWEDNNNQDGKRPDNITVKLLANGKDTGETVTLNEENKWSATFDDLPIKDKDNNPIKYTVKEKEDNIPQGYTCNGVTGNATQGFTITNTHTPETTFVSGTKTWDDSDNQDGKRPKSITVNLLQNGEKINSAIVDSSNDWQYNFTNLPKYEKGKEITYTITEDAVKDYSTKIDGYKITNSYTPGKTSVTVTKAWEDNSNADKNRPASIQVQLYANGEKSGKPVSLSELTKWTYTWSDLDAKNSGTDIKYTVKEVNTPDGYTSSVSGNAEKGFIITNAENTTPPTPVTPQPTYTTYTVHKVWDLNSGETVPDSVPMQLYKNGVAYGSPVTVTKDGWTYTWTGLPQTENGKLNTWSVKEVDPDNQYTATVVNGTSSATVTNRSNNNAGGKTQVSVHKVWKLDNGRTAASSVQAQLYRNGEAYGDPVTLSAGNSWSHVWTGLTKTDAQGNTISWTVREVNVPSGFTSTVTGTDRSFTITNDDKPKDNHNKHNNSEHPNNHNNNKNNKPVHPSNHNKNNTTVHPGTPTIPKNTGKTVANRGTTAGSTPRTGDQTSLGFWLAMLIAGAAGTAAALLFKRRNRKEEE